MKFQFTGDLYKIETLLTNYEFSQRIVKRSLNEFKNFDDFKYIFSVIAKVVHPEHKNIWLELDNDMVDLLQEYVDVTLVHLGQASKFTIDKGGNSSLLTSQHWIEPSLYELKYSTFRSVR